MLFGGDSMAGLLARGIAAAPVGATPLEAVGNALDAVRREAFSPARRQLAARRRAVIAANPELKEREALKGLSLTAAMTGALTRRGVPETVSFVAAHLGLLAMSIAYGRWAETTDGGEFGDIARRVLSELQAASGSY
ncbi:MAG: TetR/AcrR family transcriptional regulator [Acidimicrobiales bacterium]